MTEALRETLVSPAFSLTLTVLVWVGAVQLSRHSRTWFNPVLTSVVVIVAMLIALDIDYATYSSGVSVLLVLLAPAIVALALPLRRSRRLIKANLPMIVTAALAGSAAGVAATLLLATSLGLDAALVHAAIPKHATSAVSAALASATGGHDSVAAVFSVLTGIIGAVLTVPLLRMSRMRDPIVTGLALGVTAHAIGTARGLEEDDATGATAAVGMTLAAVIVPLIVLTVSLVAQF
jgi:putative effector of murein hydrolase